MLGWSNRPGLTPVLVGRPASGLGLTLLPRSRPSALASACQWPVSSLSLASLLGRACARLAAPFPVACCSRGLSRLPQSPGGAWRKRARCGAEWPPGRTPSGHGGRFAACSANDLERNRIDRRLSASPNSASWPARLAPMTLQKPSSKPVRA